MSQSVLPAFGLKEESLTMESFGSGLINNTWKVTTPDKEYILQRVNHEVFKKPGTIAHNIRLIAAHLKAHHPDYFFIAPLASDKGDEMIYLKELGFFRLFPFVPDSHSKDIVETPSQAFEAAAQFGKFTHLLADFDIGQLKITIPGFHDLALRYQQFREAVENGNAQRIKESKQIIGMLNARAGIVSDFNRFKMDEAFRLRVTHHDTKISNVLFNADGKGLCVIDLDTVMPGYFISDVGDMIRTYLSPVSEEEPDISKIFIRDEYYKAIVEGYFYEMKDSLSKEEKQYFFYAGKFMIYMQALRFLTDYLNDDIYYGSRYLTHNLDRATNQAALLEELIKKEDHLKSMVRI